MSGIFSREPIRFLPRNRRLTLMLGVLGLAVAYGASQILLLVDSTGLIFIVLGCGSVAATIAILNDWRRCLYIFFGWLFFEDFARKYLGNNMAIYFAKDLLAAVVYLSFFLACRRKEVASLRPSFLV